MSACTPRRSSARKASMCTSVSLCTRPFAFATLTAGDRPPFVDMDQGTRERLIHSLSSWHFEPHKLPEEEIIACSYILFEALYRIEHLYDTVSVPLSESQALLKLLRSPESRARSSSTDSTYLQVLWHRSCNI